MPRLVVGLRLAVSASRLGKDEDGALIKMPVHDFVEKYALDKGLKTRFNSRPCFASVERLLRSKSKTRI